MVGSTADEFFLEVALMFILCIHFQVFAIEASDVSELCCEIVAKNGYSDKITVIHGRVEDVTLPEDIKADVLISEWMGFYLLHESMLNSVIAARDRFLSPDGVMVPSTATLHICPVALKDFQRSNFDYWKNVYGFDFSPVLPSVKVARLSQPQIMSVKSTDCLSDPYLMIELDLMFVGVEDIRNIYAMPKFVINKNDLLHGFAVWFEVEFDGENPKTLSTGPEAPSTHWCQTVIILPDTLLVSKGDTVECRFVMSQDDENPRRYNISVEIPEDEEDEEEETMEDGEQAEMVEEYVDENTAEEKAVDYQHSMQDAIQEVLSKPSGQP